ncbi:MAG: hypothetical protein QM723_23975 [Myxococcaceae bacterium]
MKVNALLISGLMLLPALAFAEGTVVDAFKDKNEYYVKAGTKAGLKVGSEVVILGDRIGDTGEYRTGGKATVLEVFENLSRVSLDEEAAKQKEIKKARIAKSAAAAAPAHTAGGTAGSTGSAPAAGLVGHATIMGFGPAKRITVVNDSKTNWTKCDLRLPNNKRYQLAKLNAGDQEAISLPNFHQDGTEFDKPLDSLSVTCAEGAAKFNFSM